MARSAVGLASHLRRAQQVRASAFDYALPSARIAVRPLADRAASKLLVAPLGDGGGAPQDRAFRDLPRLLPAGALLVRNASRVMRARLQLRKPTGGGAEVLLLAPLGATAAEALSARDGRWEALIGGRRVRRGNTLYGDGLSASVLSREGRHAVVELHCWGHADLRAALDALGEPPLPPYLGRAADACDTRTYQTVYARTEGSVAAPTAGLHVTPGVETALAAADIRVTDVTLHVGAGTFSPLGGERAGEHAMHEERAHVPVDALRAVAAQVSLPELVVALGTTSVRTLESLYWLGVRALDGRTADADDSVPEVGQWEPYEVLDRAGVDSLPSPAEALEALLGSDYCDEGGVALRTKLLIVPGYRFQVVQGLVTNFHQPRSTLLMLVAAFAGAHKMRSVYEHALANSYRFLSYGDSSLYIP